jgi:hypothetical protein
MEGEAGARCLHEFFIRRRLENNSTGPGVSGTIRRATKFFHASISKEI